MRCICLVNLVSPNWAAGVAVQIESRPGCCVSDFPAGDEWLGKVDHSVFAAVRVNLGEEKKGFGCGW